jgi:crotonobetainyl-CoA:carnitine CoA-transferase CaiB-like acyl-CoA transferase
MEKTSHSQIEREQDLLLGPFLALDLTDEKGFLCGKILTDLGTEVIKVEKPGGDPSRKIGPFYQDIPHPERSLYWFAFNTGKKSITLDIEKGKGKEIFLRLVEKADFVIESFYPSTIEKLGLGYSTLSRINPRIIMTSISPFGQDGPYKNFKGPDLVVWALGGMLNICGDSDRPPVRISFPQSYMHAGAAAAASTLIAHYYRETTGEGQHVDVSAQQCVEWTTAEIAQIWEMNRLKVGRTGQLRVRPTTGARLREIWPCQDGFVSFRVMGGKAGAGFMKTLVEWMDSKGMANDYIRKRNWEELDLAKVTQEEYDLAEKPIGQFFLAHAKAELCEEAARRRIQLLSVNTNEDILKDPHLSIRDFWRELEHPELGTTITYPGPFAKFSQASCGPWHRAPLIGEHNEEIYQKRLGLSREEFVSLKQNGVI